MSTCFEYSVNRVPFFSSIRNLFGKRKIVSATRKQIRASYVGNWLRNTREDRRKVNWNSHFLEPDKSKSRKGFARYIFGKSHFFSTWLFKQVAFNSVLFVSPQLWTFSTCPVSAQSCSFYQPFFKHCCVMLFLFHRDETRKESFHSVV